MRVFALAVMLVGFEACQTTVSDLNEGESRVDSPSEPDPVSDPVPDVPGSDSSKPNPAPIFTEESVLKLQLWAPFAKMNEGFSAMSNYYLTEIDDGNGKLRAGLKTRGWTSIQTCVFRKLKIEFPKRKDFDDPTFFDYRGESLTDTEKDAIVPDLKGTIFHNAREFSIGTHCNVKDRFTFVGMEPQLIPEGERGSFGRLQSLTTAWRENAVYQVMGTLMPYARKSRPVMFTYHDTDTSEVKEKPAFLIERAKTFRKRFGFKKGWEGVTPGDNPPIDEFHAALNHIFQTLIINFDWQMGNYTPIERREPRFFRIWNYEVLQHENGIFVPIATDFDIAGWVNGKNGPTGRSDSEGRGIDDPDPGNKEAYTRMVNLFKEMFSAEVQEKAKKHFLERVPKILEVIDRIPLDDEARSRYKILVRSLAEVMDS